MSDSHILSIGSAAANGAIRGRRSDTLAVALDHDRDPETSHGPNSGDDTATDVLLTLQRTSGTDTSAHTIAAEHRQQIVTRPPAFEPSNWRRPETGQPHLP